MSASETENCSDNNHSSNKHDQTCGDRNCCCNKSLPDRSVLPKSGMVTGGKALVECLLAQGVDVMFGYPGGAIMPFYDELYQCKEKPYHILVRHEQGAVHAAEGYANITGKVGVCVATSGPGATNLITGIADAMLDSVPLVCITGQVVSGLLGSDAFQETDIIGITIPITKWNYQITSAEEIPYIVFKAFSIAKTGRPGPIVIDITKDAQVNTFNWQDIDFEVPHYAYLEHSIEESEIKKAAELINHAKRPMLLVGHGVRIAGAEDKVLELAKKASIPITSTLLGLSSCPTDNPLYGGMLGMHGNYGPNILTNEADLLIAVGMRFDDRVTGVLSKYAPHAKVIHFEIDPAEVGKIVRPDVALIGDANEALSKLLPHIRETTHAEWIERFRECEQIEYEQVIKEAIQPSTEHVRMSEVVSRVSQMTNGEAVVVSDVGQHQMMSARYYKFRTQRSYMTSGGLGTMGYSLPASIGAKVGAPDRTVITFVGDGSFQMTIQELGTVAQEGIPIKVIIMNNSYLGMVRQWQELFFDKRYSSTPMKNPDYVKICHGFGIDSSRVSKRDELNAGLSALLDAKGPYVLEVLVEQEENVFPMVPAGAGVSEIRLK